MTHAILPLEVEGLRFRYGRAAVLRGVDLAVHAGEVVALLGPNGAGKTTLFRLLCGVEQPSQGQRSFGGVAVREVSAKVRAGLAYLAHRPQVYPLLTALENVELFCELAGCDAAPAKSCLQRMGLGEVMDRRVETFSRGMAQRVAVARALATKPSLFIMDEPFTALDPEGRAALVTLLRDQAAAGLGVLVSSHDLDAVAAVADRACILREGKIVARIASGDVSSRGQFRDALAQAMGAAPSNKVVAAPSSEAGPAEARS